MAFFNRTAEIQFLCTQAQQGGAALVVLYGRRRTGKTALLKQFAKDRRAIFFVADQSSLADQLAGFSAAAFRALGEDGLSETIFPSWDAAFRYLASRAKTPLLVVLDEFSYLCESDPALPSVLQRLWDAELKETRLQLVLCGSFVSFMEQEVLGARNPLYGRRTGSWLLQPLGFRDSRLFVPSLSLEEAVGVYGILGGIPAYLERWNSEVDVRENLLRLILRRGAPLRDEPRFLMMEEVRDPRIYFSICRAVALGCTTPNEIAQSAGLTDRGVVSRYLDTLRSLRLIERRVPATERNPERTRRGHYRLADPLSRFWFRFVLPNISPLEAGDPDQVYDSKVSPYLEQHLSLTFEAMAEEHCWAMMRTGRLPWCDRIGGWWSQGEEVDVVGVSDGERRLLMGECKWSVRAVGIDVLEALQAKTHRVVQDLERAPTEIRYVLWSRSGFTPALQQRAEQEGVLLCGLTEMAGETSSICL